MNIYYPDRGLVIGIELLNQKGEFFPAQMQIRGDEPGLRLWLYPPVSSFEDFAKSLRPGFKITTLEGWPGIGSTIVTNKEHYSSFPTIITADGKTCCEFEDGETVPQWLIFLLALQTDSAVGTTTPTVSPSEMTLQP